MDAGRGQRRLGRSEIGVYRELPRAAQMRGANTAGRGRYPGTCRLREALDKGHARQADPGLATPEPDVAAGPERATDRGEILHLILDGRERPIAAGEAHP